MSLILSMGPVKESGFCFLSLLCFLPPLILLLLLLVDEAKLQVEQVSIAAISELSLIHI